MFDNGFITIEDLLQREKDDDGYDAFCNAYFLSVRGYDMSYVGS
jgi:hypothetical protein